jgi:hypothetical protein
MPFPGGTQGGHDDSQHQGSAKKAILSGVASLDATTHVPLAQLTVGTASGIATLDASSHVPAAQLALAELLANKNAVSGYAGLDANSRVAEANSFMAVPSVGVGKSLDTEYTNGTRPRLIIVGLNCNVGATGASKAAVAVSMKNGAGAYWDNYYNAGLNRTEAALPANTSIDIVVVRIIPANWSYRLTVDLSNTGAVSITKWDEVDL